MACLLVPAAEAAIVTAVTKVVEAREKNHTVAEVTGHGETEVWKVSLPFKRKVKWLTNLLWGGSALLAFEHMWHGEIVPWFPFLTAMHSVEETAAMLQEMSTAGVAMALVVTGVWAGMVIVSDAIEKRASDMEAEEEGLA